MKLPNFKTFKITRVMYPKNCPNQAYNYWLITQETLCFEATKAATQRCSWEKVFWKYTANLLELSFKILCKMITTVCIFFIKDLVARLKIVSKLMVLTKKTVFVSKSLFTATVQWMRLIIISNSCLFTLYFLNMIETIRDLDTDKQTLYVRKIETT